MKKILFIAILVFVRLSAQTAGEKQMITDFKSLLSSLESGHSINVVVRYGECQLMIDSVEEKSPEVIGGMKIEEFEYFPANTIRNPKGYIASSKTVLISHSRYGYVWNYIKFRFYEDGEVEINARYISPANLETKMNETFYCRIFSAASKGGIYLYPD